MNGTQLRELRVAHNLKAGDVAAGAGLSKALLSAIETGKRSVTTERATLLRDTILRLYAEREAQQMPQRTALLTTQA